VASARRNPINGGNLNKSPAAKAGGISKAKRRNEIINMAGGISVINESAESEMWHQ
jgi:hypothetical protein